MRAKFPSQHDVRFPVELAQNGARTFLSVYENGLENPFPVRTSEERSADIPVRDAAGRKIRPPVKTPHQGFQIEVRSKRSADIPVRDAAGRKIGSPVLQKISEKSGV